MFLELIATFIAGVGAAGIGMLARRLSGGRLPRWITTAAAGLAMIGFSVWSEYTWFARQTASLPPEITVAHTVETSAAWKPWTYAAPYVSRFIAVDTGGLRTNPDFADLTLADVYFFGRWAPVLRMPMVFDCAGALQAVMGDGVGFGTDGQIEGADWSALAPDDPLLGAVCAPT